jgi:hypothetical protein
MDAEQQKTDISARLVCQSRVLALDESTRRVKHVISTATLDRGNRIVDVTGWKLAKFKKNPVVLADHDYTIDKIIGRASNVKVEDGALTTVTEFASEGIGAVAFRLVQAGLANAWSVGWTGIRSHRIGTLNDCDACNAAQKGGVIEYGTHYTQQELLEYSLVAVPANPDAVMKLQVAGLIGRSDVDEWMSSFASLDVDGEPDQDQESESGVTSETEVDSEPIIVRSSTFYENVFTVSRDVARYAAARRSALQARRQV